MAVLQKIRSRNVLLVTIISIALLFFIIEVGIQGIGWLLNKDKEYAGEIYGEALKYTDYNDMVSDAQNFYEISQGMSTSNQEVMNQIRDRAWYSYVQSEMIKKECDAIGLAVTDAEVQETLQTGNSQFLQSNQFPTNDGRYSYETMSNFLTSYKAAVDANQRIEDYAMKLYRFYSYVQKQVRDEIYSRKYYVLLSGGMISNNIEAKMAFDENNTSADVLLASVPFSVIKDEQAVVSDDEIKAEYKKTKETYKLNDETRDIKYIDVVVRANELDKKDAEADIQKDYEKLVKATSKEEYNLATNSSLVSYMNIFKSKDAFNDFNNVIAQELDSMATGQTIAPKYDAMANVFYTVKLIDKQTQADSVLYRYIAAVDEDVKKSASRADSIKAALESGAKFTDLAKKYNQQGDSAWLTTAQIDRSENISDDDINVFTNLYSMAAGEIRIIKTEADQNLVLQVLDKKNPIEKYKVACVVKYLNYSTETENAAFTRLSNFVAENGSIEALEENAAKNGYTVVPCENFPNTAHNIAAQQTQYGSNPGIPNSHAALRWVFDDADEGDISEIYKCSQNNQESHLLVVAVTGINKAGYYPVDKVREVIASKLRADKKGEMIKKELADVKTVEAVKQKYKDAQVDTLANVTFAYNQLREPMISAAAAKTQVGATSAPVAGNMGVYMLKVLKENKANTKFDKEAEKQTRQQLGQQNFQQAYQTVLSALAEKADLKDSRYRFY